jgi:hypothetical protein
MKKAELLDHIRGARAEWDRLVAKVDSSRYEQPGVSGEWTLKDVIAHISWYEREIAHMLRIRSYAEGSEWWGLPSAEQNAHIYALNRDRSLPDILADSQTSYVDLVVAIERVSDEDLNDASRFADSPPGAMPWEIIAQNSYEHYQHHTRDLQAWLERTS